MKKLNNKQKKVLFWILWGVLIVLMSVGMDVTSYLIDGGYLFDNSWGQCSITVYWMLIGMGLVYTEKLRPNRKK